MRRRCALAVLILALALAPAAARAGEEVRLLVSVGANVGDPDEVPLRYADADAERVRRLFVELGGVDSDRAYLIVNEPADAVRRRLAELSGRIAELRAAGNPVVLFVYVSAHAKAGKLNLMGTHLPLAELRDFAAGTGARLRMLVIDACESGAIARRKGGRPGVPFEVSLERLPLHGQVVITSSGPAEASEEWESLRGSLFTHHLLTGLRGDGDVDSDGEVTLSEAYGYAFRRTVAGSALAGQHPAFDMDMTGAGELVLTRPSTARSAVRFPSESEGRYVVASVPSAHVVAEIEKARGRPARLAVPPGRYLVRKRRGRSTGLVEVELPYGGERVVRDADLVWRDFAEVAMKGGYVETRPWSLTAWGALAKAPVDGTGGRWCGGLAAQRTFGRGWLQAALGLTGARYRGVDLAIEERAASLDLSVGYRWLSWPAIPKLGLGVELLALRQSFSRDREEEIERVFGSGPLRPATTFGVAAGPVAGVEVPLVGGLFALLEGSLSVRYLPARTQPAVGLGLRGRAGVGFKF